MSASSKPAGPGVLLALLSAATFGTSGTFATALLNAGWSPAAAVAVRVSLAALVLTWPAVIQVRREWAHLSAGALRDNAAPVALYGLIAIAGCQVCYFNAVQRLSVGVALLLEYLGVILVVGWVWLRHGQAPRRLTVAGSAAAIAGLLLVLNVTDGQHVNLIGVLWGLGAAAGLAFYYVVSARSENSLPPLVMAWLAMVVSAIALIALGVSGAMPMHATFGDVSLAGRRMSWVAPVLGLAVLAAAFAYVAGIEAARRLGAKVASFLGFTEVLFAIIFAWLFLNQLPASIQLVGGVLVIVGVILVRIDELRSHAPVAAAEPLASSA